MPPEAIIGHGPEIIQPFIAPQSFVRMVQDVSKAMREQKKVETELDATDVRGNKHVLWQVAYPWYQKSGELGGLEILTQDITERRQAMEKLRHYQSGLEKLVDERTSELQKANLLLQEEILNRERIEKALRESEEQFRNLAEKSPNVICIYSKNNLAFANEKAVEMSGYQLHELCSPDFNIFSLIAPEFHQDVAGNIKCHDCGEEVEPYECVFITRAGRRINVLLTTKLVSFKGALSTLAIIVDISESRRLERELAEMEIQYKMQLGHDLHDGLGQYLTALSLRCKAIETKMRAGKKITVSDVSKAGEILKLAILKAHELSEGLAPGSLHAGGLPAALQELARQTKKLFGIPCVFQGRGDVAPAGMVTTVHLYYLAKEAVTNAVRHGKPKRISISLKTTGKGMAMSVRDNGTGFAVGKKRSSGMGLRIMRHRARTVNAMLEIESVSPHGTLVQCTIAFPQNGAN
jgi:PAS domain S-box-containing protein